MPVALRVIPSGMYMSSGPSAASHAPESSASSWDVTVIPAASPTIFPSSSLPETISLVMMTGLLAPMLTEPPLKIPGPYPDVTPPTVRAPLFMIHVLPVVDCPSILPTWVVIGPLPVPSGWPISPLAKR